MEPGVLNYQQSPLYDTYQLAAATATPTSIVFFETPAGGSKGKNLTNMARSFQLPAGENFRVAALRFVCLGMHESDILALMKNYVATLEVSGKVQLQAPIEFFSGGAGLAGAVSTTNTATEVKWVGNGVPDPRAIATIGPSEQIMIDAGQTFKVELIGTSFTSTSAVFLRCYLDGVYGRIVG